MAYRRKTLSSRRHMLEEPKRREEEHRWEQRRHDDAEEHDSGHEKRERERRHHAHGEQDHNHNGSSRRKKKPPPPEEVYIPDQTLNEPMEGEIPNFLRCSVRRSSMTSQLQERSLCCLSFMIESAAQHYGIIIIIVASFVRWSAQRDGSTLNVYIITFCTPGLPFADERRSCFRKCPPGVECSGGATGICPGTHVCFHMNYCLPPPRI